MKITKNKKTLSGLAALTWLMTVTLGYVVTHKAFSPEMLTGILGSLWRILIAASLISLAAGLGQKIIPSAAKTPTILPLALGLGILSTATLLIGLSLGISLIVFGPILLTLIFWLWRDMLTFWRNFSHEINLLAPAQTGIAILGALIVLLNLPIALAPPLAFDALTYHLTLPLHYLQAGRIVYVPEIMFWGMPQLTEMLYTLALLLAGKAGPASLSWLLGLLTIISLGHYAAQKFNPNAGWIAIAALLSGYTLSTSLSWAYVEWILLLFGLAWLITLQQVCTEPGPGSLILLGAFSGLALSVKYTAGLLTILAFVGLLLRRQKPLHFLRDALTVGLTLTLISLPWWLKNLAWTGNPFYPLLFPTAEMDALRLSFYQNIPSHATLLDSLTLPWYITQWGVDGKSGPSASIGPLLLGFSALAWLGWKNRPNDQQKLIRLTAIVLAAGFGLWAIASQRNDLLIQSRLFISLFPAWALLAAAGHEALSTLKAGTIRFGRIALVVAILFVGFNLLETLTKTLPKRALEANLGLISENAYLERNLGDLHLVNQTIQTLAPTSRVLMLWETRSFYCAPRCDPDEIIDRWYHDVQTYNNPEAILAAWKAQGYSHLLISDEGASFVRAFDNAKFKDSDWKILDEVRARLGTGQKIGTYTLYNLK